MVEGKLGPLRDVVEVVRSIVTDWDAFLQQVETVTREHEQFRVRCESAERELQELREAQARLGHDHDETTRVLSELRARHETLLREHEESTRAHHELRERYQALERNRLDATEHLEAVLRRLKV